MGAGRAEEVRIGVLGPLEVWRGPVALDLGTGMRRAVLGLLALYPNTGLHREEIIDALWEDEPPATAVNQVQAHISKLRRALELDRTSRGSEAMLESVGSSYLLRATAEQLDLLAFREWAERARAAHSGGDLRAACEQFEKALVLWRGSPLMELDLLRGHAAVAGLVGRQVAVIVEYAEAAFGVGLHDHVLPHLRALATRDPLNEKAHAQLMIALASTGHQAAALQVFDELRHRLDDQLGVYPGAELAEAHQRVLRQGLSRLADGAAGRAISTSANGRVKELCPGLPAGERRPVCQLPPALSDFTGRTAEVAHLTSLLTPAPDRIGLPVAVISGPPGVGKTALALQVAHLTRHEFPDGQLHVELAGSAPLPRDPAEILGEMLRALGLDGSAIPDSAVERAALFRSMTAEQKILVMADDAGSVDQVRPLLPGTAGCAVIVTSRARLGGLAGAHLRHLEPLPDPDAIEMLCRIVGHQRVAVEAEASQKLVVSCGRLPLAMRIVGAKLATRPSWPIRRIADVVADQRRRLDELTLDDLAFRASVMPSYEALDERARRAFRRLGLLWPADVAEWVIAALLGEQEASDVVNQLVDKSLLMPTGTDATGEPRYRLHDLLHDYAAEQVEREQDREREAALARVLTGWLEIAAAADHRLPRVSAIPRGASPDARVVVSDTLDRLAADPIAWFSAERLNLMAAARHACATGMYELAARLATHQAAFQFLQGRLDDAEQLWHSVIASAKSGNDRAVTADAELGLVQFMAERGKHAEALAVLQGCVRVFEQRGDQKAIARALHWRAYCAEEQGLLRQAQHDARLSISGARRVLDRHCELSSLRILGVATTLLGDHGVGIQACERALAIARELNEAYAEFECLHDVAFANIKASRYPTAIGLCLRGHEIARSLGYTVGEAWALGLLGDAYHALGRYHDAIEALSNAQRIFQDKGIQRGNALCLLKIALAYQALGRDELAAERLKASLPMFRALRLTGHEHILRALKEFDGGACDHETD
jgi:DNA-binding SARP family transcriptional activator